MELIDQTGRSEELSGIQRVILSGSGKPSFDTLLDEVCERLQDTRLQGSLRRIQKLEDLLDDLEQELEGYLALPADDPADPG